MLKNKFFIIAIALSLALPVVAINEEENLIAPEVSETLVTDTPESVTQTLPQENSIDEDNSEIQKTAFKQPTSKRKIVKRFFFAMLGVLVSSLMIFVGLSIYNKIREIFNISSTTEKSSEYRENSLETPDDLNGAVRSFIERTQWDE